MCERPRYDTAIPSAIVNPICVFEVISPSSHGYDRGRKFDFYGGLSALREYVIVEQETRRVEVRQRAAAAAPWRYTIYPEVDAAIALPSLGLELPMAGIYRNWTPPESVADPPAVAARAPAVLP